MRFPIPQKEPHGLRDRPAYLRIKRTKASGVYTRLISSLALKHVTCWPEVEFSWQASTRTRFDNAYPKYTLVVHLINQVYHIVALGLDIRHAFQG